MAVWRGSSVRTRVALVVIAGWLGFVGFLMASTWGDPEEELPRSTTTTETGPCAGTEGAARQACIDVELDRLWQEEQYGG